VATLGEYAFGVELDAFNGQGAMAQAHDDGSIAVVRGGAGGDDEVGGQGLLGDDQRVVAGAGEGRFQALEDALAVMIDRAGLAVHQVRGADHLAAEGLADGLMAEADAEDGDFAGHVTDERHQNAGLARRAGTGREQDAVGAECFDLLNGQLVVAMDFHLGTQFSKVLDEVVGKGIVVVENEYHDVFQCTASDGKRVF